MRPPPEARRHPPNRAVAAPPHAPLQPHSRPAPSDAADAAAYVIPRTPPRSASTTAPDAVSPGRRVPGCNSAPDRKELRRRASTSCARVLPSGSTPSHDRRRWCRPSVPWPQQDRTPLAKYATHQNSAALAHERLSGWRTIHASADFMILGRADPQVALRDPAISELRRRCRPRRDQN